MAALNAAHRGKDEPTDVLSFPLDGLDALPDGLPRQLGDVVVCPERAEADGTPIALLLVHGVLHLVGYDHEADNGDMLRRQTGHLRGGRAGCASVLRNGDETRRAARRSAPFSAARREAGSLVASFNYAFEGVIYVVRTQRNMRIHFIVALAVLPLGVVLGASRFEMLALMLSVSFVLIAEMFNTALEKAIDLATSTFDPVARAAKDIAAGAVLVAAVNAALRRLPRVRARGSASPRAARSTRSSTRRRTSR